MSFTRDEAKRLNGQLNEIDDMAYIRVDEDGEIVLDGRFTLAQLRRIVGILAAHRFHCDDCGHSFDHHDHPDDGDGQCPMCGSTATTLTPPTAAV